MSKLELFIALLLGTTIVYATSTSSKTSSWQTLRGDKPLVIARGGFSGLFPSSSEYAFKFALSTSLENAVLWCDVQMTKDGVGICVPDVKIDGYTTIQAEYPNGNKMYLINGESTLGWFSIDYTLADLQNVTLIQGVTSRTDRFDLNLFPILAIEDVAGYKPPGLWLNIQYGGFFMQHNLNMRSYVLSVSRRVIVNFISSPEVGFLRSIVARFKASKTKLIFCFLEKEKTEASTNKTYGTLANNLAFIRTFASGILVPKYYIWPVNAGQYLLPPTSLVSDAHKEGLEVFALKFMNDVPMNAPPLSYNYSYDPIKEILSFIDNGNFSVDGVLTDFPITASEAIDCFSHIGKNISGKAAPKIISHNGASGVYPGSTDLAYSQAVEEGADYIDCSVQMTSDAIPICLSSTNLLDATDVIKSPFNNLSIAVPEIQTNPGIFTFHLTWKDIQSLRPVISNPFSLDTLYRNPAYKNAGKFISLDDFLMFAKNKPLDGVLISVENAVYLAERKGLGIVDAVLDSLNKSGFSTLTTQEVIIQSTSEAVLTKFKEQSGYKRMYMVDDSISSADNLTIEYIKSFADNIAVNKESIFPSNHHFLTGATHIVEKLHSFNLPVYVFLFQNEFVSQAWDFFSDPAIEINSYAMGDGTAIDGIMTDFPGTAAAYRRNKCLDMVNPPPYMRPVLPGDLMQYISPSYLPPAEAPKPTLVKGDIAEAPLPPVLKLAPTFDSGSASTPTSPRPSSHHRITTSIFLPSLYMLLVSLMQL